jgi:hypothetical protein
MRRSNYRYGDTSIVILKNEIVALQNTREHPRERPNVRPMQRLIEIDRRLVIYIECTAQSREDLLNRDITRLNCDGLRTAANLNFGERVCRSNRQGNAEDNRSPQGESRRANGAYRDDC